MASSSSSITLGSSSIDVASLVSSLVSAKRANKDQQLSDAATANTTQISAIGNFTSSLTSLQAAIKALSTGTAFTTQKTSVGDSTIVGATADADALANSYDIDIKQLATSQKTTSQAYTSSTAAVGTGTLNISIGDKTMSLDVTSSNNSLQNIRDAINKSSDNPGVTASIVTGKDGAHLVLTSAATGKDNAFTVTTSGGDGGLSGLDFDPATDTATTLAQDAEYTIDGLDVTSASNTDATAIDGVTLTLSKVGESTVTVANDTSVATTAMQNLVTAYNSFISTYQTLTKYDETNNEVGALIGDATVTSIKSQISSLMGSQANGVASGPKSLSDLGVSFQTDGTLAFDSTKLTKALATNPKETQNLLSGSNGIAGKLDSLITGWTSSSGILTQRAANLNQKTKDIAQQQTDWDTQMTAYSDRLTTQYTALDTLMTKLQNTSSYLTQQFDALSNKS
jgi:Flagellar capping protein